MSGRLLLCAALSAVTFGVHHFDPVLMAQAPQAATRVYDNFNGTFLNPNRWAPRTLDGPLVLDLVRKVQSGKLSWSHRVAGDTNADTGEKTGEEELVLIQRPGAIREMQFDVLVKSYLVGRCPVPGSDPSVVSITAEAALFSDGAAPGSTDRDVYAGIGVIRGQGPALPANRLNVGGFLFHEQEGLLGFVVLGTVARNVNSTLRFRWNPEANEVEYQFNANPVQTLTYTQDDSVPRDSRYLSLGLSAANCTAERQYAAIDAVIDNVMVNP
jgi:hypothetical protein